MTTVWRKWYEQFARKGFKLASGKRRAVKAISDWLEGGASLFYKEVQWGQQFDREVYFKMGALAKMDKAVKQQSTNNIRETVILNYTNFC